MSRNKFNKRLSFKQKRSKKAGMMPGSLVHIGNLSNEPVVLSTISYDKTAVYEDVLQSIEEIPEKHGNEELLWLNVSGIHDSKIIEDVGSHFGIHPLVLEDIMNTDHRPKAEEVDDYLFFTLKMLNYNTEQKVPDSEQISFILKDNLVISFQEKEGDVFEPIRDRIRTGKGRVREMGPDYLLYLLVDILVDNYFTVMEHLGDRIEEIEEEVIVQPDSDLLIKIQQEKGHLLEVRKAVYPLREAISFIQKEETELIDRKSIKYFRDIYDHTIAIVENIETMRDMLATIKDIYLSSLSNKMNNIMKVLTVMSTIFIPLTFITGVYGMNFKYMPELNNPYGYFGVWGLMILVTGGMFFYFKRKDWL